VIRVGLLVLQKVRRGPHVARAYRQWDFGEGMTDELAAENVRGCENHDASGRWRG
jgi:hypothetical protein